jgi:hypothetical protein
MQASDSDSDPEDKTEAIAEPVAEPSKKKKKRKNKKRKNADDAFLEEIINTDTQKMKASGIRPDSNQQFEVLKMDRNFFNYKRELKQLFSQFGGNAVV